MKNGINKSAKRVLSLAIALVMLFGSLFTANIGANITADAADAAAGATATPIAEGTIDLLEFGSYLTEMGSTSTYYDTVLADNGETGADWANAIIIDSAEELVYLCKASGNDTAGKYYKVADGIAGFNLANKNLDIEGTLADNMSIVSGSGKNHSGVTPGFQGHFDGNGATVYGAWCSSTGTYAGLFTATKGEVSIKNIHVNKAHFTAKTAAGGIIGYHAADSMCTVTVENCSVTDSYIEVTGTGWATAVGGIIGWANSAPSWKEADKGVDGNGDGDMVDTIYVNVAYNVKNCFVDLDEQYFISAGEGTEASSTIRTCHGGVVGGAGSNAVMVTNCVTLGVTPYSISVCSAYNDVQHTGGASHYKNVYTDQATGKIQINYNTGWASYIQDFSPYVFQLTPAQMQGAAAVSNMNLEWFSVWKPGAEGEYPTFVAPGETVDTYFWDGSTATEFESGTGTKEDPFIIKTPAQLYLALTKITGTTSTTGDLAVETAESVAGGYQSDRIFKQGSTTVYAPVYTPYYYKVADGVKAFYLNNVYGNETLAGAKAMGTGSTKKDWKPGKSFVGYLDGNGVTIYGMYSSTGQGLVYKLDGASTVKNFNFNACYSSGTGNAAMVTTFLGTYSNDSTIVNVANISVRNSYIGTTAVRNLNDSYQYSPAAGGIIATQSTCENITVSNCLYDGYTCERVIGNGSEISVDMLGSIYSGAQGANNFTIDGCVSLGAPAVDEVYIAGKKVPYTRYDKNQGFQVFFYNSYSDIPSQIVAAYPGEFDKLADITRIEAKDAYEMFDMPKLPWSNWTLAEVENGRVIPMPTVNTSTGEGLGSYTNRLGVENNKHTSMGPYYNGVATNPLTFLLKGSGTEADPFLIETDIQLARAIATGGMDVNIKLYYKLANDIDLSSGLWIQQTEKAEGGIYYYFREEGFAGTLDGDGHTITGLSAGDEKASGLIPVLASGGVVKNLHVRNSNAISSTYAGIIVGDQKAGSTITNCSVENSVASSKSGSYHIIGNPAGTYNTIYFVTADGKSLYVNESGTLYGDYVDGLTAVDTMPLTAGVWYKGGKEGSTPKLVNHAKSMINVDVTGDGKADAYGAADLTALRNKLLKKSAYDNIYGDVSRNGTINLADLAVLQRTIVGNYGTAVTDGFWANVETGSIDIYYGENDNYDAARKLELYLENQFPGVDIVKHVSSSKGTVTGANSDASKVYLHKNDTAETPDGKLDIIVGNLDNVTKYATNNTATAANTYAVTYDAENEVLWLQGQNFTAVEQAVLDFIAGSDAKNSTVFSCGSTVLATEKWPITVKLDTNYDGVLDTDKTLYYAWGDEFEEDQLNTGNWTHNSQQSEGGNGDLSAYWNQELAPVKDYDKLIVVSGGRLSMKRGFRYGISDTGASNVPVGGESANGTIALEITDGEFNGYNFNGGSPIESTDKYFSSGKIVTSEGMLYKQGYIEFQGQLPADGHAFPAWWLMGRPGVSANNKGYDNSLYGKVYKLNEHWNGENNWDEDNLDTYKYQIPTAIYEIDMIEVMQHGSRYGMIKEKSGSWLEGLLATSYYSSSSTYSNNKAVAWYMINSTIHKYYTSGVDNQNTDDTSDDVLHIADWDNYKIAQSIPRSSFSTSSSAGTWIHNIGSTELDFGTPTVTKSGSSYYIGNAGHNSTVSAAAKAGRENLEATRKYGFSWNTSASGFEATLYVYNTDGTLWTTVPIAKGMSDYSSFKDGSKNAENSTYTGVYSDEEIFNQYMYILLDNKFYSANPSGYSAGNSNYKNSVVQFSDLLSAAGLTSLEVDYVRVYQEDNFRDIVTPETEAFNNNNHFGYF